MPVPRLLTIEEAAKVLRLSRNGLLHLIKRGELAAVRYPGTGDRAGRVVIAEDDLLAFLNANKTGSA